MKIYLPLFFFALASLASCNSGNTNKSLHATETDSIVNAEVVKPEVVKPDTFLTVEPVQTSYGRLFVITARDVSVHFVDSVAPDSADQNIVLSVAAAFTGQRLSEFRAINVCGNYVSDGVFHKGYKGGYNSGYFLAYDGKYKISDDSDIQHATELAIRHKGQLFQQYLIVKDGVAQPTKFKVTRIFRSLALIKGELAIVQAMEGMTCHDFIQSLVEAGVDQALYLDMGGWQYGWYRDQENVVVPLGIETPDTEFQTNWIMWKKR